MMNKMRERLKIDIEPKKIRIESEPYVLFIGRSFVPVIDIYDIKFDREYFLIISAKSISLPLKEIMDLNDGKLIHSELWINKESNDRFSPYQIEHY